MGTLLLLFRLARQDRNQFNVIHAGYGAADLCVKRENIIHKHSAFGTTTYIPEHS